jgi:hypothetical protein
MRLQSHKNVSIQDILGHRSEYTAHERQCHQISLVLLEITGDLKEQFIGQWGEMIHNFVGWCTDVRYLVGYTPSSSLEVIGNAGCARELRCLICGLWVEGQMFYIRTSSWKCSGTCFMSTRAARYRVNIRYFHKKRRHRQGCSRAGIPSWRC